MKSRLKLKDGSLVALMLLYCALTLLPFYFLTIRAFTPTIDSSVFRLWIPERPAVDFKARIGNLASVNSIDIAEK